MVLMSPTRPLSFYSFEETESLSKTLLASCMCVPASPLQKCM